MYKLHLKFLRNGSLAYLFGLLAILLSFSCKEDKMMPDPDPDPEDGLEEVFEFSFSENSGNTTQETETGNLFTITGNGVNRMDGVIGNALFFDGLSNEANGDLPSNLLPSLNVVISLWASPKSFPVGNAAMIALTSGGTDTGLMVGLNKFGQVVVQYYIDGNFYEQVTDESLERDQWNHVVVGLTPQKKYLIIYLDGEVLVSTSVPAGTISWPTTNTSTTIGKNTMGEMQGIYDIDYFSGSIDEIKIYKGEALKDNVDAIIDDYPTPDEVNYAYDIDYSEDTNRPIYHPIPDYGWANESYGLVYLDGTYHMFYQKNDVFLGISQQNWGHLTSTDLVSWNEESAVLWPTPGWDHFGTWSGDAIILEDGTPAVVYTGVDGAKAGIGIATSTDNYQTLDKETRNPVIPGAPPDVNMDFRDPYVWFEDGLYHMIVGSGISSQGGNIVYYTSPNFTSWGYQGIAFQGSISNGDGEFWEMPVIYEFPNGKEMLLVQKTPDNTPARTFYWIGQFENGVFTPDFNDAKDFEVVNGFLSPAISTDKDGLITAIGIIPDEVSALFHEQQGWANLFSVPQVLDLDGNDNILISPHPNLENLRGGQTSFAGLSISDGGSNYLDDYTGRYFELEATINTGDADQIGFIFGKTPGGEEEYRVYYDMITQEWVVDASNSSTSNLVRKDIRKGDYSISPGSSFDIRVFIDGSVLEVFIDNKSHFTGRFFPTFGSATGVDLFATGGNATVDITLYLLNN